MTEKMLEFLKEAEQDAELAQQINAAGSAEEIAELAKAKGFELTEEDLAVEIPEALSDEDIDSVVGGAMFDSSMSSKAMTKAAFANSAFAKSAFSKSAFSKSAFSSAAMTDSAMTDSAMTSQAMASKAFASKGFIDWDNLQNILVSDSKSFQGKPKA